MSTVNTRVEQPSAFAMRSLVEIDQATPDRGMLQPHAPTEPPERCSLDVEPLGCAVEGLGITGDQPETRRGRPVRLGEGLHERERAAAGEVQAAFEVSQGLCRRLVANRARVRHRAVEAPQMDHPVIRHPAGRGLIEQARHMIGPVWMDDDVRVRDPFEIRARPHLDVMPLALFDLSGEGLRDTRSVSEEQPAPSVAGRRDSEGAALPLHLIAPGIQR